MACHWPATQKNSNEYAKVRRKQPKKHFRRNYMRRIVMIKRRLSVKMTTAMAYLTAFWSSSYFSKQKNKVEAMWNTVLIWKTKWDVREGPPRKKRGMGPKKVIWCHLFFPFFSRGASPNKRFWAPHETECVWHCSSMVRGWGLYLPPLSQYYSMWDTVRDSSQLLLNLRWTSRDLGKGLWQIQNHGLLFVDCPSMMHRSLLYDGSITLSLLLPRLSGVDASLLLPWWANASLPGSHNGSNGGEANARIIHHG